MRQHRIIRSAGLALALAAFTAPATAAPLDLREPVSPAAFPAPPTSASQDLRNADSRNPAPVVASASQDLRSPDTVDAAAGRGTFSAPRISTVVKVPGPPAVPAEALHRREVEDEALVAQAGVRAVLLRVEERVSERHAPVGFFAVRLSQPTAGTTSCATRCRCR